MRKRIRIRIRITSRSKSRIASQRFAAIPYPRKNTTVTTTNSGIRIIPLKAM